MASREAGGCGADTPIPGGEEAERGIEDNAGRGGGLGVALGVSAGVDRVTSASAARAQLPSGIVTFLLTDIEESTRLWEADANSMATALVRHDELLDELTRFSGGVVIKSKGEGDATLAAFPRASEAATTALAVQRAFAVEAWSGELRIKVRMALHTGEAYERGGDYYGPALNRAARLRSLAQGGQILVSQATAEVLADRLPEGATLLDLGRYQLRGLARGEEVFQLCAPGLASIFVSPGERSPRPTAISDVLPVALAAASDSHFNHSPSDVSSIESWAGAAGKPEPAGGHDAGRRRRDHARDGRAWPLPPAMAAAPGGFLVGRDTEVARLTEAFLSARGGRRQAVFVAGEPGIGKTALVAHMARQAHAQGARVLYGHCDEELELAYQPFAQAIGHYIAHCPSDELSTHVAAHGSALSRLGPELTHRLPDLPPPGLTDPEADRFLLLEAVTALLELASQVEPVVLIVEDLHWAAKGTLLLLRHILRSARPASLLIVGTYRQTESRPDHPLAVTLADLRLLAVPVGRIQLKGLNEEDVARFVAEATSDVGTGVDATLVRALQARTDGNPFFVGELLRHLAETRTDRSGGPTSSLSDDIPPGIPEGVRDVVDRRLNRLSEGADRALTMASVIGEAFDLNLLEQIVDGPTDILDAMEEAMTAHLVVELGPGHYRFAHALVRESIYSGLTATRRGRHHRRVGEALERLADTGARYWLPPLAYHFAEAAPAGCASKAADYALAAARQAIGHADWEDAVAKLERGLRCLDLDDPPDVGRRCDLLILLAEAWTRFFSPPQALVAAEVAVELARVLHSPERLGTATYLYVRAASASVDRELMGAAEELADEALETLGDDLPGVRSKILAVMARIQDTRAESSESTSRRSLELARRSGDPDAMGVALLTATGFVGSLDPRERLALAEELVLRAPTDGWDGWRDGHSQRAMARLALGDRVGFEADAAACERVGVERRFWFFSWIGSLWRTTLALVDGRFCEVEALTDHALALTLQDPYRLLSCVQMFRVRFEQGDTDGAKAIAAKALEELPENTILRSMLAVVLAEAGHLDEARHEYEKFADDDLAGVPWPLRPIALAYRSEIAFALDDAARAGSLYDHFLPYAGQIVISGVASTCVGAADRFLGMLASELRQWDLAARHFEDAFALEAGLNSPPILARTSYWHGRMLFDRSRPGDADRATASLLWSLDTAERLGMASLAEQARSLLAHVNAQHVATD